jgi:hypothetical protein
MAKAEFWSVTDWSSPPILPSYFHRLRGDGFIPRQVTMGITGK